MKKHKLLKKASRKFPVGTVYTWGGDTAVSCGTFKLYEDNGFTAILCESSGVDVYNAGCANKWASIVGLTYVYVTRVSGKDIVTPLKPKEALIMSHDGVPLFGGDKYFQVYKCGSDKWSLIKQTWLTAIDMVVMSPDENLAFVSEEKAKQFVLFKNNVKENNESVEPIIRMGGVERDIWYKHSPLILSHDGVPLYEGSSYIKVTNGYDGIFTLVSDWLRLDKSHNVVNDPGRNFAFSNFKKAKEFVEAKNKNKTKSEATPTENSGKDMPVEPTNALIVSHDGVLLDAGDRYFKAWHRPHGAWTFSLVLSLSEDDAVITCPDDHFAFFSEEKVKAFVEDKNTVKPEDTPSPKIDLVGVVAKNTREFQSLVSDLSTSRINYGKEPQKYIYIDPNNYNECLSGISISDVIFAEYTVQNYYEMSLKIKSRIV